MWVVDEGQHEGTRPPIARYFMVDAGDNGTREKGCQYLIKLESTKMDVINLNEKFILIDEERRNIVVCC